MLEAGRDIRWDGNPAAGGRGGRRRSLGSETKPPARPLPTAPLKFRVDDTMMYVELVTPLAPATHGCSRVSIAEPVRADEGKG